MADVPRDDKERQQRWSALLAAKNAEITRLRQLAGQALLIASGADSREAREIREVLAGCGPERWS